MRRVQLAAAVVLLLTGLHVVRSPGATVFDFGEWSSEMATRANADGTTTFATLAPGINGAASFNQFELMLEAGDSRTLSIRDAQHAYVFTPGE